MRSDIQVHFTIDFGIRLLDVLVPHVLYQLALSGLDSIISDGTNLPVFHSLLVGGSYEQYQSFAYCAHNYKPQDPVSAGAEIGEV